MTHGVARPLEGDEAGPGGAPVVGSESPATDSREAHVRPETMRWPSKLVLSCTILLLGAPPAPALPDDEAGGKRFIRKHEAYAGLYRSSAGEDLVVGLYPSSGIIHIARSSTGDVRFLDLDKGDAFRHGPTRSALRPKRGTVTFSRDAGGEVSALHWTTKDGLDLTAAKVPLWTKDVRFQNGSEADLQGTLVTPPGDGPYPAALLITQSDRFDLWDVGMALVSRGIAVLVYDRRNAETGWSTGEVVAGYDHEVQRVHARDALAAVKFLKHHPRIDGRRVGVIGWSGGGWIGAMVAGAKPGLAFYVNVAGNASPWLDQVRHKLTTRLMREGFSREEVQAAGEFLDLHLGVARGQAPWEEYTARRDAVSSTRWHEFLTLRENMTYADFADAREWGSALESSDPARDYAEVTVPTLGIFFQYDHSSPPDTPWRFQRALIAAGNGDYALRVFPGTNHGAWKVNGYRFDPEVVSGRDPAVLPALADWVEERAGAD